MTQNRAEKALRVSMLSPPQRLARMALPASPRAGNRHLVAEYRRARPYLRSLSRQSISSAHRCVALIQAFSSRRLSRESRVNRP
jgi:hypothetical protein